jgi:hypothetical protein
MSVTLGPASTRRATEESGIPVLTDPSLLSGQGRYCLDASARAGWSRTMTSDIEVFVAAGGKNIVAGQLYPDYRRGSGSASFV